MSAISNTERPVNVPTPSDPHASFSASEPFQGLTYCVLIFGCQMNRHDGERISGILDRMGARSVLTIEEADIVIYLTCCVRERAEVRVDGQIATMKSTPLRPASPLGRRIVAVGGCVAQKQAETIFRELPHVNIVFGTHNVAEVPSLIQRALAGERQVLSVDFGDGNGASRLPAHRERPWSAWVSIITGCNNFCSYCIVPYVRGRESSRDFEEILTDVNALAAEGVREVTLLGQNVNSYGRDRYGAPRFAELLEAVNTSGIERIRFATSHPKDLSPEVIEAFGRLDSLAPALHLPVQSGSDRILAAMNRGYTGDHYLKLIEALRTVRPDIALSTDIIVGFPGETEQDFEDTLALVQAVGYHQAFTFIYSPREGTKAAGLAQTATDEEIQDRFDRLVALVQDQASAAMSTYVGSVLPVLVDGGSERDSSMLSGRGPGNQMIHAPLPPTTTIETLQGTIVPVQIEQAHPWYLAGTLL